MTVDTARLTAEAHEPALTEAWTRVLAGVRDSTLARFRNRAHSLTGHHAIVADATDLTDDGGEPVEEIFAVVNPGDIFDVGEWAALIEQYVRPALAAVMTDAASRAAVGISFDVTDPAMVAAVSRHVAFMTDWSADMRLKVTSAVETGMQQGWSIPRMVQELTDTGPMSAERATVIARTTSISSANAGTMEGWRAVGNVEAKIWTATEDARTREDHADADGQTVALDQPFSVGGEDLDFPGDPSGSAAQTANCRCTIVSAELTPDEATADGIDPGDTSTLADDPALADALAGDEGGDFAARRASTYVLRASSSAPDGVPAATMGGEPGGTVSKNSRGRRFKIHRFADGIDNSRRQAVRVLLAMRFADDPAPDDATPETGTDPASPSGAMVALYPDDPASLPIVDGGLTAEDLHITLMFLGASLDDTAASGVSAVVESFATKWAPVEVTPFAVAEFNPDDNPAVVLLVESDQLDDMYEALEGALTDAGISLPEQHAIFVPHITLGYGIDPAAITLPSGTITCSTIASVVSSTKTGFPLTGSMTDDDGDADEAAEGDDKGSGTDEAATGPAANIEANLAAKAAMSGESAFAVDPSTGEWEGVLVIEGISTGDGRFIAPDALTWRPLPLPIMWMFRNPEGGYGHDGAEFAGNIATIERRDGGVIWGTGTFDLGGTAGTEAARLVANKLMCGVSIDLDMVEIDYGDDGDDVGEMPFDDGDADLTILSARIMGACYDEETEILTETRGWQHFATLHPSDRVATRNPKTDAFEWQAPVSYTNDPWNGQMYHFTSGGVQTARKGREPVRAPHRALDLLVTPNHRMLVESTTTGKRVFMRADELATKSPRSYRFLTTSEWDAPDVQTFRIPGREAQPEGLCACGCGQAVHVREDARTRCSIDGCENGSNARGMCNRHYQRWYRLGDPLAGGVEQPAKPNQRLRSVQKTLPGHGHGYDTEPLIIDGDDFAAFMGAWLSEGCLSGDTAIVCQQQTSKGYEMFKTLLDRMFPTHMYFNGRFVVANVRLANYLRQFGTALVKHVPDEIKNFSARQLRIFLDHYIAGDGDLEGRRIFTSSPRMAGDLQEIAQKLGMWAVVSKHDNRWRETWLGDRRIEASGPGYRVALRNRPGSRSATTINDWKAEVVEDHVGMVRCVTVPNECLYVRRNGIPAWCGNTGTAFPAFLEAMIGLPGTVEAPTAGAEAEPVDDTESADDETPAVAASAGKIIDLARLRCARTGEGAVARAIVASGARGVEAVVFTPFRQEGHHMAVVASAGNEIPVAPPAAWFAKQDYDIPFPMRVSANGRITGFAAPAEGTGCHLGSRPGRPVRVPACTQQYRKFQNKRTLTAEGTMVATGVIYMDTVHPNLKWNASDTQAFYANTGCAVADVHVYADRHGLQICGAVRPDAKPEHVRALRGSDVSPDWRPDGRGHMMVGLLAVNVSGFIEADEMEALVASAGGGVRPGNTRALIREGSGELVALVASGGIREMVAEHRATAAMRAEMDAMHAQVDDLLSLTAPMRREKAKTALAGLRRN